MITELGVRVFKDGVEKGCSLFSNALQINCCFRYLMREFTNVLSTLALGKTPRQPFDVVAERGVRSDRDRQAMAQRIAAAAPLTRLRSRAGTFFARSYD
jgi:hypothetical protein